MTDLDREVARLGHADGRAADVGGEVAHLDGVVVKLDGEIAELDREVAEWLSPTGQGGHAPDTEARHTPAAASLAPAIGQRTAEAAMADIDALFEEALGGGL
jgi:hypothetical protein